MDSFQNGFDGWDIYTESRTNTDRFQLGGSGYQNGACPSVRYPDATGVGLFKQISVNDTFTDYANTDFYAYLYGIRQFANPDATTRCPRVHTSIPRQLHSNDWRYTLVGDRA